MRYRPGARTAEKSPIQTVSIGPITSLFAVRTASLPANTTAPSGTLVTWKLVKLRGELNSLRIEGA